jgi:Fe-Mn family superoxide dismutase
MNKRKFLKNLSVLTGGALVWSNYTLSATTVQRMNPARSEPFSLPKLPYDFGALEPNIDAKTMEIHHGKHHAAYIAKLNDAVKGTRYETVSIEDIIKNVTEKDAAAIRNNGGGHYNHAMFWESMAPNGTKLSNTKFITAMDASFGSFEKMKELFVSNAKNVFGSGWTWICMDKNKNLMITNTPNQDNPLMTNIVKTNGIPILGLDVWEHAYYLKYQNNRADYINKFFNLINWNKVEERYLAAL